jgi:DNA end-binding protein Ku
MAKAFWKGVISFGLVVIPVKMYTATRSVTPTFHLLHKKCSTRPRQVLYCPLDEEYFGVKETVRGYEYAKGQFIPLDDSDFKKVPLKTMHAIDIVRFVPAEEIDPIYYYGNHYLEPEELGARPFSLLRQALQKTQRVGVAKVTFQRREHLSVLRTAGDSLVLHTIHFNEEILPRVGVPAAEPASGEELQMATSLVMAMAGSFNPEEYEDEYSQALQKLIEAKVKGEKVKAPSVPKVEISDLMSALRLSVEQAKKARPKVAAGAAGE